MAVKIVTDSTSDLPPEIAGELGITVVPLNIHFGMEVFKDGVDLPRTSSTIGLRLAPSFRRRRSRRSVSSSRRTNVSRTRRMG